MRRLATPPLLGALLLVPASAGCPAGPRVTDTSLERIRVAWPKPLKKRWEQRLAETNWMRRYLVVSVLASRAAVRGGVPKQLSLNVQHRVGKDHWRVHFGRLATDQTTFVATHRVDVRGGRATLAALPKPLLLPEKLAALARAVRRARLNLHIRSKGWLALMQKEKRCWFNHLVRRRADGRIDVFLVAFSEVSTRAILGGDYHLVLSADGQRVEGFRSLHGGLIVIDRTTRSADAAVPHHIHRAAQGELPTATDLLKVRHSPVLGGLVVVGPRYTVYLERHPDKAVWSVRLLDSQKYRALILGKKGATSAP